MTNEPTKIPALLQRWSEVQPEVCVRTVPYNGFRIGEYSFWYMPEEGGLMAQTNGGHGQVLVTGRPALAWLRDAVEAAIEATPGKCKLQLFGDRGWAATIGYPSGDTVFYESAAHALLAAFVAWAEGVRE